VHFRYTFADLRQHLTLSILANFQKWRPAKYVKYRRQTRVQISASEAFAKRKILRFFIVFVSTSVTLKTTSVTVRNYTLVSSGNGHSIRTRARSYYGRSRPGLRPDPGCARYYYRLSSAGVNRPFIEMTIPSSLDSTLAPPGGHVVQLFTQYTPYKLASNQQWTEDLKNKYADTGRPY